MGSFPTSAKVVIIGAGIVGNSLAYHLANLGWRDILLIDKGALPNPGGSTGHASNFLYLVDHNKEMAELTLESARQYKDWGVYTECGGLEVARTVHGVVLAARAGFRARPGIGVLSAGLGAGWRGASLDYAFIARDDPFGATHHVSATFDLGAHRRSLKPAPEP